MKLIVGLGNPGRQYENTRHNVGFRVIDNAARRWQMEVNRRRFNGEVGGGWIREQQVLLLKPMTFMNLSGQAVREAMTFHKLAMGDLLVIADDMALPLGRLRIRAKGSAGGHNGLLSLVAELGSEDFARLRVGIGWMQGSHMVDHVLSAFSAKEEQRVTQMVVRAADAAECWLTEGTAAAMNKFNRADEENGD